MAHKKEVGKRRNICSIVPLQRYSSGDSWAEADLRETRLSHGDDGGQCFWDFVRTKNEKRKDEKIYVNKRKNHFSYFIFGAAMRVGGGGGAREMSPFVEQNDGAA